jgi:hypothetical protein
MNPTVRIIEESTKNLMPVEFEIRIIPGEVIPDYYKLHNEIRQKYEGRVFSQHDLTAQLMDMIHEKLQPKSIEIKSKITAAPHFFPVTLFMSYEKAIEGNPQANLADDTQPGPSTGGHSTGKGVPKNTRSSGTDASQGSGFLTT